MVLTRRAFLQRTGWAIAALGLSQSSFFAMADRQQQALAQPARQQRALLIGINQYPESVSDIAPIKGATLLGCLTDVELQRELLIHRFGFAPTDILALTDDQATRQSIEAAVREHLMLGTRSGDRLLIHFSGLGSRVRSLDTNLEFNTLVPIDGILPSEDHPTLNDMRLSTLQALLQAMPTDRITTVIDAAFLNRGTSLQGNFRIRSRPSIPNGRLNLTEQALQEANLAEKKQPVAPIPFPGLYLGAAAAHQPALEGQWTGFSAGLLTYALTQYLWEITPARGLQVIVPRVVNRVDQLAGGLQKPVLEPGRTNARSGDSVYTRQPILPDCAGVVQGSHPDGSIHVWLGGVPAQVLECYGEHSVVMAGNATQAVPLVGRSRHGLILKADLPKDASVTAADLVGQPVQEAIRFIPRTLGLTIALDPGLERIERVDATSAFAAAKVNVVAAGEQAADLLFGKHSPATLTASSDLSAPPPAPTSYGLFYPPRLAVPGTLASADEAVKTAVTRLTTKLPRLLAIKYLKLTENPTTSRLALRATLETTDAAPQTLAVVGTRSAFTENGPAVNEGFPRVAMATALQCHIQNLDTQPLYLLWVAFSQASRPLTMALLSDDLVDPPMAAIAPGSTLSFPQAALGTGLVDLYLIASRHPFQGTAALIESQHIAGDPPDPIQTSLSRVQAILQDLSNPQSPADGYALDVNNWATVRLRYQIT